ncbi:uncharacterized protein, partial [Dermacentor andersoni]|uniref:uncharacterized protein n=1 Tax=Dermacentor andersoni TaxID=34620 RepID=UPI003B3BC458
IVRPPLNVVARSFALLCQFSFFFLFFFFFLLFPLPLSPAQGSQPVPTLANLPVFPLLCLLLFSLAPAAKTFFFTLHTSTRPVKTWLQEKGLYVPWNTNRRLCNQPDKIEHCFILCRDAFHFGDILQRTLKKDFPLTYYGIRFLPFKKTATNTPYDLFMLLGLYSLWSSRMIDRHAEPPRSTRSIFREETAQVRSVVATCDPLPEWISCLDACVCLPEF